MAEAFANGIAPPQALDEVLAGDQRLQDVRQRDTLQALAETFVKTLAGCSRLCNICKPWPKRSVKVNNCRLVCSAPHRKLWLTHQKTTTPEDNDCRLLGSTTALQTLADNTRGQRLHLQTLADNTRGQRLQAVRQHDAL
jgi:hypothetical protein